MNKKMDQETARKLFEDGGIFIFLNVPEGTEFGIDMKSWNTGEKFRGVKMIPPGLHYIFYSSVSNTGDISPRTGFFHNFKKSEILAKKWDAKTGSISDEVISDNEIVGFKSNIRALDNFLGPYPYDIQQKWLNLISNISENLLQKLIPQCGYINSALELESCTDANRPRGKKLLKNNDGNDDSPSCSFSSKTPKKSRLSGNFEDDFLPDLKPKAGTALRLTELPIKSYPDGSTPAEITRHSLDSTYALDVFVSKYSEPTEIIGELQFCYVCFLVGHSLEAFEHWKKIISLLCSCETAVTKYRKLYNIFISMIQIHIKEIPEDFLADIVTNNNFVYVKLRNLFRVIDESNVDGELKMKVERFKKLLTDTYFWDFEDLDEEDEDEAPVIVET